jgi:glycosyltransferase involved in cell wall biosynthesis
VSAVLHVTEVLERHGGTPRKLLYLVQHGDPSLHRHHFVTFSAGSLDQDIVAAGGTVHCTQSHDLTAISRGIYQTARRVGARVICTHFTRSLFCGSLVARVLGLPVIHNAHGPATDTPRDTLAGRAGRLASHWSFPATALVTANSRFTASSLQQVFRVPEHKLRVLPNPVVPRGNSGGPASEAQPARREGRLRLVQVGGLIPVRRQHVLIEGLARIVNRGVDAELLMVGDGPLKDALVARSRELGVTERVLWLGFRDDVGSLLASADLYVSAIDSEGFGIAVVEAMLAGLPVLLANGGAHPELVNGGRYGVLFDAYDAEDLAQKTLVLWSDAALRRDLATAAQDHAKEHYQPRRYAQRFQGFIDEVCGA